MDSFTTNEEIALEREWVQIVPEPHPYLPDVIPLPVWVSSTGKSMFDGKPPDFEHEWAHAGPLWGEMARAVGLMDALLRIWVALGTDSTDRPLNEDLLAATSRAWLAWKKEEKDGNIQSNTSTTNHA